MTRDKKGRFKAINPEIWAISIGLKAIKNLGGKSRRRVVQYLYSYVTSDYTPLFPWEETAGED